MPLHSPVGLCGSSTELAAKTQLRTNITSIPCTPAVVEDDMVNDGKPFATHQAKKQLRTPVTDVSDPTQVLSSISRSNTENEADPSSDDLSKAGNVISLLVRDQGRTLKPPPIVLLMESLLMFPLQNWRETCFPLICTQTQQPILVIDDGGTKYTLSPSIDTFQQESRDGYTYNLRVDKSGPERLFHSGRHQGAGKPDIFIPLGWLVESKSHQSRTTRYVCLWNTSTKPNSLWLAYDYCIYDLLGDPALISELGIPDYFNDGYLDDVEDDSSSRHQPKLTEAVDQSFDEKRSPAQPRNEKTKVGEHDLHGYLGAMDRFDIGMIINDVTEWDSSEGIKGEQARQALLSTGRVYGNALQPTQALNPT